MQFKELGKDIIKKLDQYYQDSIQQKEKVITQKPINELIKYLNLENGVKDYGLDEKALSDFVEKYLSTTTRLHHPNSLAHQVTSPHFSGALASLIDGFTNNPMAIYEMGPGAATIEFFIINWLLKKIGWQPFSLSHHNKKQGGGVFTHGGSLANLTALIAARTKSYPDVFKKGNSLNFAIITSSQSHYSITRAAGILGIGEEQIYPLDEDENGKIIPNKIEQNYNKIKKQGKNIIALIASACSTAVGIYDDLKEIGQFCNQENLWFHVDGAHGASVLLSKKHKKLMDGIQLADSLTWDAHKLMRTPSVCAALLVKDAKTIDSAFHQEASYLFHDKDQPGFDFMHRALECTKSGLALKFFMVLASLGEKGLEDYIDEQYLETQKVYEYIQSLENYECPVKPESNILCFKLKGTNDEQQILIRDQLIKEGDFHISTTSFKNVRYLRIVLMNPKTKVENIKALIENINRIIKQI